MKIQTNLHKTFAMLPDPRVNRRKKHKLMDIIILSILAVLSGADSWDDIELYGKTNYSFLKQILELPNGIPSHDTINRVFGLLNARLFERLFIQWAQQLKDEGILSRVIAIDGKTIRGSQDAFHHTSALHMVHAWSVEQNVCLGQYKTACKSNEITAIPELLSLLDIQGQVITIDAMGTQVAIAQQIIAQGGDYILGVKENQKSLKEEVLAVCSRRQPVYDQTDVDKGHGRIETRRCQVFDKCLMIDDENRWSSLKSIIKITSTRVIGEKTSTEERYYISSLDVQQPFNTYIRNHWKIENTLHWTLDMTFREDEQRKRAKQAGANFAIIRKIALNLLKKDKGKASLKAKRLMAGWNPEYLIKLLQI